MQQTLRGSLKQPPLLPTLTEQTTSSRSNRPVVIYDTYLTRCTNKMRKRVSGSSRIESRSTGSSILDDPLDILDMSSSLHRLCIHIYNLTEPVSRNRLWFAQSAVFPRHFRTFLDDSTFICKSPSVKFWIIVLYTLCPITVSRHMQPFVRNNMEQVFPI